MEPSGTILELRYQGRFYVRKTFEAVNWCCRIGVGTVGLHIAGACHEFVGTFDLWFNGNVLDKQ